MNILSPISLLLVSALVIFSPLQEGGTTHPAQMIIRLLIVTWLGIVLAAGIRAGRLAIPVLTMRYVVLAFVGLALAATILSPYPHPSRQWLIMIAGYATLFYLLVSFVDRWEHIRMLTLVIVLMGVGEAGWAIMQGLAWNVVRPAGTFFNPNFLAGYLTVTWTILVSGAIYGYRQIPAFSRPWMSPVLWWLGFVTALGMLFLAVLFTQSRGGMIVCLVGTGFVLTARYGWKLAGSCVAAVVLLGLFVPTPIRDRVLTEHQQNPVSYARWQMWQGAVAQMVDHPFGIGLGLYQYTYPLYAFPIDGEISRFGKVAQTPHNDYLQMGVEMGPGAILVFGIGVVLLIRELRQVLQSRLRRWQRSLIVGIGGGVMALLTHAALDSSLRESALAIMLALCSAMIVSAARLTRRGADAVYVIPIHSRWTWGIGVACLVLVVGVEVTRLGVAWMKFDAASRRAIAGDTDAAIEGLKAAVSLDPGKALYHHGLGSVYARAFEASRDKQAFQLAYAEFKQAIELNPLDSRLLGLLGQLYLSAARVSLSPASLDDQQKVWLHAAVQVYERAIQLSPFSAMYRYEQARLYWMLGERSDAERRGKEAENLEPNFLPARALLARLWIEVGQVDQARGQVREILARQARYKERSMNSLDHAFMNVDVGPLLVAVGETAVAG
ncbi:MAG: O-antigen ligase family protein [Nitrospira sp.]|jgi:Tfp pilus assembly protein PilF|uniref:O-antigen ligase family protein n=1 Tax=Nitrospira sp. ND1 TaxID=1658518 RepID=UPI0009BB9A09|nr:O-antigen ligase family protein [Nitrospira sp. ND1]MBK7420922.1 O-antigen ligase family protein [Nitrospira sp.]MBK7487825.1 O-antigen ligase family protein [Nitrospira sp.]MBP6198769.1 O-antigen ligase family protein [Nitrospira sp.]MBP6206031.1 O-antigen ligase family protein [Nitrospira sp.]MBP8104280.1 O-antigen ligase family protein [Nitrospira sp.]